MAVLFAVSSLHHVPSPPAGLTDKHEHFMAYAVLGLLALRALARGRWSGVRAATVVGAIVISGLYGVTDEFHQRFVSGRDYEVLDMVADTLGAAAAASALWAWVIIKRRSGQA